MFQTFDNNNMSNDIESAKEKFRDVLDAYNGLIGALGDVGIHTETASSKQGLAFLVDETKKKNQSTWMADVDATKSQIVEINTAEGKSGVTWYIAEKVSKAYLDFLDDERQKAKTQGDEELANKLDLFMKMTGNSLEFKRKARKFGKPISFGGISASFIPEWCVFIE